MANSPANNEDKPKPSTSPVSSTPSPSSSTESSVSPPPADLQTPTLTHTPASRPSSSNQPGPSTGSHDTTERFPDVQKDNSNTLRATAEGAAKASLPSKRSRVRFNSKSEVEGANNQRFKFPLQDVPVASSSLRPPEASPGAGPSERGRAGSDVSPGFKPADSGGDNLSPPSNPFGDSRNASSESVLELKAPTPKKPRPSVLRTSSANSFTEEMMYDDREPKDERGRQVDSSVRAAQERARRVASAVKSTGDLPLRAYGQEGGDKPVKGFARMPTRGGGGDRRGSGGSPLNPDNSHGRGPDLRLDDIPLADLDGHGHRRGYHRASFDSSEEDSLSEEEKQKRREQKKSGTAEAHKLVRSHTMRNPDGVVVDAPRAESPTELLESGAATPTEEREFAEEYVARPEHYRGGVLANLLKLYNAAGDEVTGKHKRYSSLGGDSRAGTPTPGDSGTSTPNKPPKSPKWYKQKSQSTTTLANLVGASAQLAAHAHPHQKDIEDGEEAGPSKKKKRPGMHSRQHSGGFEKVYDKLRRPRLEDEIRITVHIAETLSRQRYLIRLCRALMAYGAPTHRLEEYMRMTARVLELDVQVLYIPGCMLISFDDASTHTTEVKLVRTVQGINLGKLKDVHEIYKEVVHDVIGVEEATQRLDAIIREKQKYHKWMIVPVYGLASACVGPFAFESNFIDLPIAFILGCCLGFLQLIVAPKSDLYANVFEISAAVVTSFLARAFGSINHSASSGGGRIFCFSALAQSSIALILPGYIILCGSLELQSKNIVAGSVRMFYAVIYSLFLGFGITIGTALYGAMDGNAVSSTTCAAPMPTYLRLIFVPLFSMCLAVINQAKLSQTPVMVVIAFAGYIVNFFTARRFPSAPQVSQTLGAFTVGVLGNLYSRLRHGVAAAALLPAIFVQVPSGLAAGGSLLAGLTSANDITSRNGTNGTAAQIEQNPDTRSSVTADMNNIVFNVGYSMIQVAIGITVGLFLSALVVYPLGKRRSGLFSF